MVLGVDAVVVRTPFEDFTVRVQRRPARPEGPQLDRARWAASELRFGIDMGDPAVTRSARELVQMLDGLGFGFARSSPLDPFSPIGSSLGDIAARLEEELLAGRLAVERERLTSLTERRALFDPKLPPLPPPNRESTTRTFEVRFVDEIGKAISGLDAEFTADGAQTRSTNAAGIALLDGVRSSSANVALLDPDALSKVLDPRWETFRPGTPPKESNTTEVVFVGGELGPFPLKAELPNTVVIKPPLGQLFVELWDKTGRVRHANRTYRITGPRSFEGTTDDQGRLQHLDAFPGDYSLSLALAFFEGTPDAVVDIVDVPLVVLDANAPGPEVRQVGVVPRSVLATLDMFFNTNKSFLLPTALPSIRTLRELYTRSAPCKLLVVGHADTTGSPAYNDALSLERAEAVIAYLKDDHEAWLKPYEKSDPKQRWGKVEDHLMLISLPDFATKPKNEDEVRWFQRTRNLRVDGTAGKETRTALIREYMSLDGTSLSDFVGEIDALAHGCGENFPLDDSGRTLDTAPADAKRDPIDRRVELFFFDAEFGIVPAPPGKNSKPGSPQYPRWREGVSELVELSAGELDGRRVTFVELEDARFRSDSAVVLPEGENPNQAGEHGALTSVGLVATALRYVDDRPNVRLLVAGHTDSSADSAHNDELSRQRAQVVLALLEGNRETFSATTNARHKTMDVEQILSWVSRAFPGLTFACDPGVIDGKLADGPIRNFQRDYNKNKQALGATAPDLVVDGKVGEATWGAFFDCYEAALREELGEDAAGLAGLRAKLQFADPDRKSLGFGERFPLEELGVDDFRSQTNRRVELLFFDAGEEPDLAQAEADPDTAEVYLPGGFVRTPLPPLADAKPREHLRLQLLSAARTPLAQLPYRLVTAKESLEGVTNADGFLEQRLLPGTTAGELTINGATMSLVFGDLAPAETPLGAQQRLSNLGMQDADHVDGQDDDEFQDLLLASNEARQDRREDVVDDALPDETAVAVA